MVSTQDVDELSDLVFEEKTLVTAKSFAFRKRCSIGFARKVLSALYEKEKKRLRAHYVMCGRVTVDSSLTTEQNKSMDSFQVKIVEDGSRDAVRNKWGWGDDEGEKTSAFIYSLESRDEGESSDDNGKMALKMWTNDWNIRKDLMNGKNAYAGAFFCTDIVANVGAEETIERLGSAKVSYTSSDAKKGRKQASEHKTKENNRPTSELNRPVLAKTASAPDPVARKTTRRQPPVRKTKSLTSSSSFSKRSAKKKKGGGMMGWLGSKSSQNPTSSSRNATDVGETANAPVDVTDSSVQDVTDTNTTATTTTKRRRLRKIKDKKKKKSSKAKKMLAELDDAPVEEDGENMDDHEFKLAQEEGGLDMRSEADMERERRRKQIQREREEAEAAAALEKQKRDMRKVRKRLVTKTFQDEEGFFVQKEVWEDVPDDDDEQTSQTPANVDSKKRASPSKPSPNKDAKKRKTIPKKKKKKKSMQKTTMMSFFSKK